MPAVLYALSGLISNMLRALPCPKAWWEEVIHPLGISTLESASSTLCEPKTSKRYRAQKKRALNSSLNPVQTLIIQLFKILLTEKQIPHQLLHELIIWTNVFLKLALSRLPKQCTNLPKSGNGTTSFKWYLGSLMCTLN